MLFLSFPLLKPNPNNRHESFIDLKRMFYYNSCKRNCCGCNYFYFKEVLYVKIYEDAKQH